MAGKCKSELALIRINKNSKSGKITIPNEVMEKAEISFGDKYKITKVSHGSVTLEFTAMLTDRERYMAQKIQYIEDMGEMYLYSGFKDGVLYDVEDFVSAEEYYRIGWDCVRTRAEYMFKYGYRFKKVDEANRDWKWATHRYMEDFLYPKEERKPVILEAPGVEDEKHKKIMLSLYQSLDAKQQSYVNAMGKQFAVRLRTKKLDFVDFTNEHLLALDRSQISLILSNYIETNIQ
jgi:hypothetical protein